MTEWDIPDTDWCAEPYAASSWMHPIGTWVAIKQGDITRRAQVVGWDRSGVVYRCRLAIGGDDMWWVDVELWDDTTMIDDGIQLAQPPEVYSQEEKRARTESRNRAREKRMRQRVEYLKGMIKTYEKVWSKPFDENYDAPGGYVTGWANRSKSLNRMVDQQNNRKAKAFARWQSANQEVGRLESILSGYAAGECHLNGQKRKRMNTPAREISQKRR